MVHDVVIPFRFDTAAIEEQIKNIGESEVAKVIREVTLNALCSVMPSKNRGYYHDMAPSSTSDIDWRRYVDERMYEWLNEHADEIIDEAALLLAAKAKSRKRWRDVLAELKDDCE